MAKQRTISVVVPVYNSETSLPLLIARLEPILKNAASRFEVILVNDGSKDRSWDVIQQLATQYSFVRGMNLMRNYGQHNALLAGIRSAECEIVVTIDDDLQDPPEESVKLLGKFSEGYEVVYGKPQTEQHGLFRDLASRITKLALQGAIGAETAQKVSAFRVFRTDIRRGFENYMGPHVSIDVLLTWGATRFAAVPVRHEPRTIGQSNYTFRKLVRHAMNMMTGFSTLPLQFASVVGFAFTSFGLIVLVYVVGRYLIQGTTAPGFPFLASIIAIFSGAQLFALGIIGEYLARMHFRMMDRPPYVVEKQTDAGKD
jgi:glycosyltransferase involved in cell wall biosynthesis